MSGVYLLLAHVDLERTLSRDVGVVDALCQVLVLQRVKSIIIKKSKQEVLVV